MPDTFETFAKTARSVWMDNGLDGADYVLLLQHDDERLNTLLRSAFA